MVLLRPDSGRAEVAGFSVFRTPAQVRRAGNQPNAHAAIRNLITGVFRRAGFANITHVRRYYGRDDARVLALSGYT